MHNLALALYEKNYMITGSDDAILVGVANAPNGYERESQQQTDVSNSISRNVFGNQGDPSGSPDTENYDTGGGLGQGISFGGSSLYIFSICSFIIISPCEI